MDIPFESFMVGGEPEGNSRQQQSQNQRRGQADAAEPSASANDEQADKSLSFWV
ncbi:MAG TPA: hypothetical protein VGU67_11000 [Edaphobacter sp.]|nr:hypothetical protein [Edaphobacter sp.]